MSRRVEECEGIGVLWWCVGSGMGCVKGGVIMEGRGVWEGKGRVEVVRCRGEVYGGWVWMFGVGEMWLCIEYVWSFVCIRRGGNMEVWVLNGKGCVCGSRRLCLNDKDSVNKPLDPLGYRSNYSESVRTGRRKEASKGNLRPRDRRGTKTKPPFVVEHRNFLKVLLFVNEAVATGHRHCRCEDPTKLSPEISRRDRSLLHSPTSSFVNRKVPVGGRVTKVPSRGDLKNVPLNLGLLFRGHKL